MAGDWQPGLDNLDAMQGLPPMASPLTQNGEDPDEAALKYFSAANSRMPAAVNPVQAATAQMQRAAAQAPPPTAPSTSAAAAGAAGGAGDVPSVTPSGSYQDIDRKALASGFNLSGEQAADARQEGDVPSTIQDAENKQLADQGQNVNAADYKPGFGTRLLRGLRGAGIGLLTGGVPGALVGAIEPQDIHGGKAYGAPTDAYDEAVNAHNQTLTADATSLQNAKDNWQRASEAMKARQTGLDQSATTMGDVAKNSTGAQNADTSAAEVPINQEKADTEKQKALNESPDGRLQASQAQIDQRTAQADRMKIPPGYIRNRFILTGDMQAAHDPSAQEIELAGAERAFRQEHGRGPQTVAEWQQLTSSMHGEGNSGDDKNLRAAVSTAQRRLKDLQDNYQKDKANFSRYSVQWDKDELKQQQASLDDAQKKIQDAQQEYDSLQGQLSGRAPSGGGSQSEPPPTPATHVFSRSAWLEANPKRAGDVDRAVAKAQKQGYQIQP